MPGVGGLTGQASQGRRVVGQALGQLNDIFGMIERLQSVDTAGIEPMSHPLGGGQRLREDLPSPVGIREAALRNAPAQQDGLFLVPRVIE